MMPAAARNDDRPQWVSVTAVEVLPGSKDWPKRANPKLHRVWAEHGEMWICLDERWREVRRLRYWRQASPLSFGPAQARKLARLEQALGEPQT